MRSTTPFLSRSTSLWEIASGKYIDSTRTFYLCTTINAQNGVFSFQVLFTNMARL